MGPDTKIIEPGRPEESHLQSPSWDRNAARAGLGGEFPTRTLSVMRRVPNSTIPHVSASPPCHPGRSDFPNPVGDHGISPVRLPSIVEA